MFSVKSLCIIYSYKNKISNYVEELNIEDRVNLKSDHTTS